MSIRRTRLPFERDFVRIPNAWMRDKRLSRRARGLLAELMTHREGFRVSVKWLVANGTEGRDAVRHMITELAKFGYLKPVQTRQGGKFAEMEYELADPTPQPTGDAFSGPGEPPEPENPAPVFPAPENPHPKKTSTPTEEKTRGGEDARDAVAPPTPVIFQRPDPWCSRHASTRGTDDNCGACGRHRRNAEAWDAEVTARSRDGWAPKPTRSTAWPSDTHCEHGQRIGHCDACDQEARKAREVLEAQFGVTA